MKKRIYVFWLSLCILLLLSSCGRKTDAAYVGKWIPVAGDVLSMPLLPEELSDYALTLEENGRGTIVLNGETENIRWSNKEGQVFLTAKQTTTVATEENGAICFSDIFDTGASVTFAKEGTPAAEPEQYLTEEERLMPGDWQSYEVKNILGADMSGEIAKDALTLHFSANRKVQISMDGKDLGTAGWSMLGTFGSLDDSDLNITWEIKENEIEAAYYEGDKYYTFRCKK